MIDKNQIEQIVEKVLQGTDCFLVEVTISSDNKINVEIDSDTGVDIDTCALIDRTIEAEVDRDVEDYELEVGSSGLTSPFKIRRQYEKNIGNEVEVLTRDGRKLTGTLASVSPDGKQFTLTVARKVKEPGKKKPVMTEVSETFDVDACKYVRYSLKFK